jgi:hypothetical protein
VNITKAQAERLASIVDDIDGNVIGLNEALAELQDSPVKGNDRDALGDEVKTTFEDLRSNVRVFAKGLEVDADIEGNVSLTDLALTYVTARIEHEHGAEAVPEWRAVEEAYEASKLEARA